MAGATVVVVNEPAVTVITVGIQGPAGSSTLSGADGARGMDGLDGLDGEDGIGIPGRDGVDGVDGRMGLDGLDGEDGIDGIGVPGRDGVAGVDGRMGADGLDGLDGEDGIGIPGRDGVDGAPGAAGPAGADGRMGIPGMDGEDAEANDFVGVALRADQTYVTPRFIGDSPNLDIFLKNLDASQTAQLDSGWESWAGAGNYYSIAANAMTLLRGGSGYISGRRVVWTAPQVAATFTSNAAHWLYIDVNGAFQVTTTVSDALYANNIVLFEVHYDGTNYEVVIENHPVSFDSDSQRYLHKTVGTVITPPFGQRTVGADMTRVTTGTGAVVTDRQVSLVGAAVLSDHGLETILPDSAGAAVNWSFYYTNALGNWVEYVTGTPTFPMVWNNAGTVTALNTSGTDSHSAMRCYAVKAEPNTGAPIYIAIIDTAAYPNIGTVTAAITAGTVAGATGTLFQALEPAQLGVCTLNNTAAGGYIDSVVIAKDTLRSGTSSGGTNSAALVTTDTSQFIGGVLSASDTTVQSALNTLSNRRMQQIPGQDGEDGESGYIILQPADQAAATAGISLAIARAVVSLRL